MDPPNCMDSHGRVVSYLFTLLLCSLSQNRGFSWIPLGCQEWCGGVLMVDSLPSSSVVSPQWTQSCLNGRLQVLHWLCSTTIFGQIDRTYIYRKLNHACHISNVVNHVTTTKANMINTMAGSYGTRRTTPAKRHSGISCPRSLPQTCGEVSAAPKFDYSICHISQHPECTSITAGAVRNTWECSWRVCEHFA